MDRDFPDKAMDEQALLSRRRFMQKAGLLGLGAFGIGSTFEDLVPDTRAEGTQSFLHRVQRSGTQSGGGSPQRKRKTVSELLTILQSHPGGPQAIEAARRRGANFSLGATPTQPPKLQGNPPVTLFSFSVVLVPGQLQVGNNFAQIYSVDILKNSAVSLHPKTMALFSINFPKKGWYLLNIEGLQTNKFAISARLEKGVDGPGVSGPTVQTWSYPSVPAASEQKPIPRSFPAMFEYTGEEIGARLWIDKGRFSFLQFSAENL